MDVRIRSAESADLDAIASLDARLTGTPKALYWQHLLQRYAEGPPDRCFLVAETMAGDFIGFAIGEVRAWEFGAPPCGWIFAIQVDPARRLQRAGTALFAALRERFNELGVYRLRTLVDRKDHLILSFFRAQGMRAGPSLQLELDETEAEA